jgi:hypothetical protein
VLCYPRRKLLKKTMVFGERGGDRTRDQLIKSQRRSGFLDLIRLYQVIEIE